MRKIIGAAACMALMLGLCAFLFPADEKESEQGNLFSEAETKTGVTLSVFDTSSGKTVDMPLEEYVAGVVLSEMPVSFHAEALKAQAVAARTYALEKSKAYGGDGCSKHPEADVCTSSACCQGYVSESRVREKYEDDAENAIRIAREAVESTAGEAVFFRGHPICAMYHASSGGHTEDAENVYASAVAYLRGVESPGEEAYGQYSAQTTVSRDDLVNAFKGDESVQLSDNLPLSEQVEVLSRSATGRATRVRVGLCAMTGSAFRRKLGLKSANFTMEFSKDAIVFSTLGYGHGVGMSQTGADAMARRGADYREILNWYYTGVEIRNIGETDTV